MVRRSSPFAPCMRRDQRCVFQLVELKNGETFNGHLVQCDNFMNITLREVYQTSAEGDRFWKLKECYIRGSTVRSLLLHETWLCVRAECMLILRI